MRPSGPIPKDQRSEIDKDGIVVREGRVTAVGDGDYAVNTTQSIFLNNGRQGGNLLPPQTSVTIGDRLSEKGIDWTWYSGGWNLAIKTRTADEEKQLTTLPSSGTTSPSRTSPASTPRTRRAAASGTGT